MNSEPVFLKKTSEYRNPQTKFGVPMTFGLGV